MQTVQFTQMRHGTKQDYDLLHELERGFVAGLPDRVLAGMRALDDGLSGYQVTRLEHSLQAATRAERDGVDIDWIVAALIHDIGDGLAPANHAQVAGAIIRPYVRAEVAWVVNMHGVFQLHYFGMHTGDDPDAREAYRDHKWFGSCEHFCERWDEVSFDPAYPWFPLEHFEPALREVFARPPFDPSITGE